MAISSTSGRRTSLCTLHWVKWHNCILQCRQNLCWWILCFQSLDLYAIQDAWETSPCHIHNVKLINDSLSPRAVSSENTESSKGKLTSYNFCRPAHNVNFLFATNNCSFILMSRLLAYWIIIIKWQWLAEKPVVNFLKPAENQKNYTLRF